MDGSRVLLVTTLAALLALLGAGLAAAAPLRPPAAGDAPAPRAVSVVLDGGVLTITGDAANNNIILESGASGVIQVSIAGAPLTPYLATAVVVDLRGGNDTLRLKSETVLFWSGSISFDGGDGFDTFAHQGDIQSAAYAPGPGPGDGSIQFARASGGPQAIEVHALESVADIAVGASLTVDATNADNAITYRQSESDSLNGLVAVDGFATYEFRNKHVLVLNAQDGDDVITIANPEVPSFLGQIVVDGGDASAGDTLVSVAEPGSADVQVLAPLGQAAGNISSLNQVTFSGIEKVHLVGQLADADSFGVDGTAGDDHFEYFPGPTPDSGTVHGLMDQAGATSEGPFPLVEVNFSGMAQSAVPTFNAFGQSGGLDIFVYHSGEQPDDIAASAEVGGVVSLTAGRNGLTYAALEVRGLTRMFVDAGGGDDRVDVNTGGTDVSVNGGGGQDFLVLSALGTLPPSFVLDLDVDLFIGESHVAYEAVERLHLSTPLIPTTIAGRILNDSFHVREEALGTTEVSLEGYLPLITVSSAPVVIDGGMFGADTLTVIGANLADVIDISDVGLEVDGMEVGFGAGLERLVVDGRGGADTISMLATPPLATEVYGGSGADTMDGSEGDELMDGGPGADYIDACGGDDLVFGGDGDDHLVWNASDDDDYFDGGPGSDRVTVNGRASEDEIDISVKGAIVRVARTNAAPFELFLSAEKLEIKGRGGADRIVANPGLAPLVTIEIHGGGGSDVIRGGDGNDLLIGGGGDDLIRGGLGRDRMLGQAGADDLFANDNEFDRLSGGQGADWARLDIEIDSFSGIEQVFDG